MCEKFPHVGQSRYWFSCWPSVATDTSMNLCEHKYTTTILKIQESAGSQGGEKRGYASKMEVVGRWLLSGILDLALQERGIRLKPRFKLTSLLAHPHLYCRLRRVHRVLLMSAVSFREHIPAATMIAKPTMRMKNRFAALLALPNQFYATPNTKTLSLMRQRVTTTLRTNPIFVERHWDGHAGEWLTSDSASSLAL